MQTMIRVLLASTVAILAMGTASARAGDCIHDIECPECHHVCKFSVEKEKEKHHCWKIKIEPVCIPRVKFPWESCCKPPKCAKMKYVRKLEKHEYECEVCKYKWTPECAACGAGGCCGAGAGCSALPAEILDAADVPAVDTAPTKPTAPVPPGDEASRQRTNRVGRMRLPALTPQHVR
jgi:hypothetical protein